MSRLRNKRVPSRQLAASSMAQMSAPEATCAAGNPLLSVSSSCAEVHRCFDTECCEASGTFLLQPQI